MNAAHRDEREVEMLRISRTILAAAAMMTVTMAQAVQAQQVNSYPRVVGTGENASIEYGPDEGARVAGGGLAQIVGTGESASLEYRGLAETQSPLFAFAVGSGEDTQIIYSVSPSRDTALAEAGLPSIQMSRTGSPSNRMPDQG